MSLGEHTRNPASGRIRKERSDAKVENLKKEYPVLAGINGNMHLGTLEKKLGVDSLGQALKVLRGKK